MKVPVVAGDPVALLRLPPTRFRNPRDVVVLIGGVALLAALLISVAVARGPLLGPDARPPSLLVVIDAGHEGGHAARRE